MWRRVGSLVWRQSSTRLHGVAAYNTILRFHLGYFTGRLYWRSERPSSCHVLLLVLYSDIWTLGWRGVSYPDLYWRERVSLFLQRNSGVYLWSRPLPLPPPLSLSLSQFTTYASLSSALPLRCVYVCDVTSLQHDVFGMFNDAVYVRSRLLLGGPEWKHGSPEEVSIHDR
jgi:hypothetical protein